MKKARDVKGIEGEEGKEGEEKGKRKGMEFRGSLALGGIDALVNIHCGTL